MNLSYKSLIAVAIGFSLLACKNMDTTIHKVDAPLEASPTADYELVSTVPDDRGLYKVNDLEAGNTCYLFVWNGGATVSCVQVAYIPDGTPP